MSFRKNTLAGPVQGIVPALNEDLEDLGQIGDERIRPGANISVAKIRRKSLGEVTVGASETLVRHGFGQVPTHVSICMTGPGSVWLVRGKTDSQRLYLQADAAARTAIVVVWA